jgi:hypothetical protein
MTVRMLVLLAAFLAGAAGHLAYASCNAVPDPPLAFHGARGTINRAFVGAGDDVVLQLDNLSSGAPTDRVLTGENPLIAITFRPTAGPPRAFFVASEELCRELEEPVCFLKQLFCHPPKTCFKASDVNLEVNPSLGRIAFRFPNTGFAGPVTIAVGNPSRGEKKLRAFSRELENPCSALVPPKTQVRTDIAVCIDKFRQSPADDPPGAPTFTELVTPPPTYDYRDVCSPPSSGDPACKGTATEVSYTVETNGDVLMRVDWSQILEQVGSNLAERNLRGSTAVEAVQCAPGQGCTPVPQIYVPSAAFLQSTDCSGAAFGAAPTFVPQDVSDSLRPNEQTFLGTADQPESCLAFKPRVQWNRVCSGGDDNPVACEQDSDCSSASTCTQANPAYFACDGGTRDKLPCTQTRQCPGSSGCRLVSKIKGKCVLRDGTLTATGCGQDSDCGTTCTKGNCVMSDGTNVGFSCKRDSDCGMCGPGLFEFRSRTATNGQGTLKHVAANVRGVCDGGNNYQNVCRKSSDCSFLGLGARCVVFRLEALSYVTTKTP